VAAQVEAFPRAARLMHHDALDRQRRKRLPIRPSCMGMLLERIAEALALVYGGGDLSSSVMLSIYSGLIGTLPPAAGRCVDHVICGTA